ncbi:MAG: hypothetical protein HUU50_20695 [Candidatus Brocadiae bacterium]|nr:hypothetical protein [Candidatus Brocadiia bacterium]
MQLPAQEPSSNGLVYNATKEMIQEGQLAVLNTISRQQNLFFIKTIFGMVVFVLVFLAALGFLVYYFFRPIESVEKNLSNELDTYKKDISQRFTEQSKNLQENYHSHFQKLYDQGQEGYKELLSFLLKLQKDYEQKILVKQKEELLLQQRSEKQQEKIQELNQSLSKAEWKILELEAQNKELLSKESLWKKEKESYQKEVEYLKKQLQERLTKEELESLKRDLEDGG